MLRFEPNAKLAQDRKYIIRLNYSTRVICVNNCDAMFFSIDMIFNTWTVIFRLPFNYGGINGWLSFPASGSRFEVA